jgi:ribonuclease PH
MRPSNRELNQMRDIVIETDVTRHAEGSCLIKIGDTHVLCTASLEERVPPFLRNSGLGWVTAEYGCCPAPPTQECAARPKMVNRGVRKRFSV